jgi:hypothetical protein
MTIQFDTRPTAPTRSFAAPDISLLRENLYCVLAQTCTMGYVERVGNVFVALAGSESHHAVEVGQSLSFDVAVSMVERSFHSR